MSEILIKIYPLLLSGILEKYLTKEFFQVMRNRFHILNYIRNKCNWKTIERILPVPSQFCIKYYLINNFCCVESQHFS